MTDKQRIDWLEKKKYLCYGINYVDGIWRIQIETGGYSEVGSTLRSAIDVAISKETKKRTGK